MHATEGKAAPTADFGGGDTEHDLPVTIFIFRAD